MSTQRFRIGVNGFVDGLNTEASVLEVLPSEMMRGSKNVELLINGEARRRKGADFIGESDAGGLMQLLRTNNKADELHAESPSCVAVKLTAPSGAIVERLVVDLDNSFYVYGLTTHALSNIDDPYQIIDRTGHSSDNQKYFNMQFAASGNRLYFTGLHCNPGYLKVATDNVTLEVVYLDVIVRDPNATAANVRRSNNSKYYECIETHTSSGTDEPGVGANWQTYWFQIEGAVPSGATGWITATSYTSRLVKQYNKNTAPIDTDTYPTSVEFYAGRIWLTGDPKNPNAQYFSKVIVGDRDAEIYMQSADPFNADDPDLVDDDGGVIKTQGMALAKRLVTAGLSLFIGANNGVWQISGADGIFKATNFSNHKILLDGVEGTDNMLRVEREVMIFGQHSIWKSTTDNSSSLLSVTSGAAIMVDMSSRRVASIYNAIPIRSKAAARVLYNATEQRVYYFFTQDRTEYDRAFGAYDQPSYHTHMLVLESNTPGAEAMDFNAQSETDKQTKRYVSRSITLWELEDEADKAKPFISAPFITIDIPSIDELVKVDSENVLVSMDTVLAAGQSSAVETLLFLALRRTLPDDMDDVSLYMGFGTFNTDVLNDWDSYSKYARGYSSIIISGVQTLSEVGVKKAATYIYLVFKKVESGDLDEDGFDTHPGGCNMRTAYNFSTSPLSKKFSTQKQVYFPDRFTYSVAGEGLDGHNYTWFKDRARGRGNTLSVIFESDETITDADGEILIDADGNEISSNANGKDFHLVGWSEQFYGKNE